jgi:hypothetical protein
MGFKYHTLVEIVELLREWKVPDSSVSVKLINRAVAEITDEGHPLTLKWYLKGLIDTGLIQQVGPGTYDIIYTPKPKSKEEELKVAEERKDESKDKRDRF